MAFGTLRKDSYFTPGEVLEEATQLDAAVRALAEVLGNHLDDPAVTPDFLAGWNAFVESWRSFWGECNGWTGWIFRAENSTRDQLLAFEDQYTDKKSQVDALTNGATAALPEVAPESARTEDNISSAVSEAGGVLQKAGWETIAGAAIVVVGLVVLVAVARRGGVPVPA